MCDFGEAALAALRAEMETALSPYRFAHTLGVEREAAALAELFCPEKAPMLRAAALLHDSTKEFSDEAQLAIFAAHGVVLRPDEAASPKIWHGMTAALEIPTRYPAFADAELLSAVRWHTTGHADMSLTDALLYLADFIEPGRTFDDCVRLRQLFWDAAPARKSAAERLTHLSRVLRCSMQMTIDALAKKGRPICLDTLAAAQWLENGNQPF